MSVNLVKTYATERVTDTVNGGNGPVEFIGPFPVAKAPHHLIRVGGADMGGVAVRHLSLNGPVGDVWVLADGSTVPVEHRRSLRGWLRHLLDSGAFAGFVDVR